MYEMGGVLTSTKDEKQKKKALLQAIKKKQAKQVARLIAAYPKLADDEIVFSNDASTQPLAEAAAVGHKPTVQLLLAAKADVNARRETPCRCCEKTIPANALFLAATRGHYAVVQLLLQQVGVELTGRSRDGDPALLLIARNHFFYGHQIVQLLLERELADPNQENTTRWARYRRCDYKYPITQALVSGNPRIAALLLQHGASLVQAHDSLRQFKYKHINSSWYFDDESWARGLRVLKTAWAKQQKKTKSG